MEVLVKVQELLNNMKNVRDADWKANEIEFLNMHNFITSKPIVYLVNISVEEYVKKKNKHLPKI